MSLAKQYHLSITTTVLHRLIFWYRTKNKSVVKNPEVSSLCQSYYTYCQFCSFWFWMTLGCTKILMENQRKNLTR